VKAPPGASRTRYLILGLAFVGLSLNYLDRANLSVGLLLDLYDGSYLPSFAVAGAVAVIGALTYAFVVGRAEPLPVLDRKPANR
jgi:hypothetical protein